jgi:CheY-like chemotaxis protein
MKHVDILVVDDNQLIANSTCEILNLRGFCAIAAYDGSTALSLAAEMNPDILLSDVMMPIMNGVELAISVRKILPETAVLLITALTDTKGILEEARRKGYFFDVASKPIYPDELIRRLDRLRRT